MPVRLTLAVYTKGDAVFVPTVGRTDLGLPVETDKLVECALSVDELAAAIKGARAEGNPAMPHPSPAELARPTALQRKLGKPSSRKMARMGMMLSVLGWDADAIRIAFTSSDADDVLAVDYGHELTLPLDTSDEELARQVIQEVFRRRAQPS